MRRIMICIATLLLTAAASLSAQQSIVSDRVDKFTGVSINGNISIELIPADENKVDIMLYDTGIDKFKWSVKDETLSMKLNSGGKGAARVEAKVFYADSLQYISASGGQVVAREEIESLSLHVDMSGGAKANVKVDLFDFEINVTGNSMAEFTGDAKYFTARATEKSKVMARSLDCVSVDAEAATGAELTVSASERLTVNAKTTATIFYRGKPTIIKDRTSKMNSGMMGSSIHYIGE